MASFSFPEDFVAGVVADEFKACFYQLACFLLRMGHFGREIVVFEVDQLRVDEGVVDVSVSRRIFSRYREARSIDLTFIALDTSPLHLPFLLSPLKNVRQLVLAAPPWVLPA